MSGRRRAAVIGCGDVSVVHFDAIEGMSDVDLVAVCDADPERLATATTAAAVPGFLDYLELFARVRPDVVHICTPHHLHASIAIAALERGINVVLEKPLAHTRAEGQRLVEVAERSSAKIAVCFQNRYNAPVQAARELLASGDLGAVLGGSATVVWQRSAEYYRDRPWRGKWATAGGGLLMNQAIHTLDLLQWLVGDVVGVRGSAATHYLHEAIEVEDTAEMVLDHANGARSVFYATLANVVNAPVTLDIVTEGATLSLRKELTVDYADGRVDTVRERATASGGRAYWGISHALLIEDFYARIDDADPFWIGPREAAKTLGIIQDVYGQSFRDQNVGNSF